MPSPADETSVEATLIAERLGHAIDKLRTENETLRKELEHYQTFANHRLTELERTRDDHEKRIRSATDGVTGFRIWSGLASGGSLLALVKTFFLP